jgi:hypothetical protein
MRPPKVQKRDNDRSRIIQKALRQFKELSDKNLDPQNNGGQSDPNNSAIGKNL